MTRADLILIIIVMSILPFMYTRLWTGNSDAGYLQIQAASKTPITEELSPDRTIHINGPLGDSVIEINNGRTRFISSPCRNKVCVQTGWLETSGDLAACLPNRISIFLLGEHPRFDAINF